MHLEAKIAGLVRTKVGSLDARKLRRAGRIPANLYGHKQDPVPLSFAAESLTPVVKSGVRVVDVEIDGKSEKAMLWEVQWDTFSQFITHVDLVRVDENERVEVEVSVELKGAAPGATQGGVVEVSLRHLRVECLAHDIPDHIIVKIGDLQLDQIIHIRDIEVPPNMTIKGDPNAIVVRCAKVVEAALPEGEGGPAQPELIGRKPADEAEEAAGKK